MGENGKRIYTLLLVLTNRNIICTRSYAMKLKGLATGERGDSLSKVYVGLCGVNGLVCEPTCSEIWYVF